MLHHRALPCASALSLFSALSALSAQAPATPRAAAGPIEFAVGNARIVMQSSEAGSHSQVSRDGGRSFQSLPAYDPDLYLRCGTFDPLREPPPMPGVLAAPANGHLFVVQTATSILPEYRQALIDAGLEIVGYFPKSAYVVRGDRNVAKALSARAWVRWVGDLPVGYRLEEQLVPLVAAADAAAPKAAEYNVVLARKADRGAVMAQIRELRGEISNPNDGSVYLQARLTPVQLAAVAALDTVIWIDATTPIGLDMDHARIQGGANYIESVGGFTGAGVRAEITEGLQQTHPDWTLPPLSRFDMTNTADAGMWHGHCTSMIVGGNGSGNPLARGMMPDCQIIESSYQVWGTTSRYTLIQGSVNPLLPWQAMQQTASWGNTQTVLYTSVSQELDNALFDFDLVATQSQSNLGDQRSRPQAWAKNVISVGGVVHHDNADPTDDNWNGASIGPESDGALKPDICAYYDLVLTGDLVGSAGYTATNYNTSFNGTSSATPIVNGHVGLMQQMFTDGLFGNPLPQPATAANRFANRSHMTTMKALLTNTAASYPFTGTTANLTRTHQGWGFPDLKRVWDNRQQLVVNDEYDVLAQGQSRTYLVWIRPGTPEFRATMVYADPECLPSALIHRINSVDLNVTQFSTGTTWWGNNGLNAGNVSVPGTVPDDLSTIEQVWLGNPASDIYRVTVSAPVIVQDGHVATPQLDVSYALVMHPVGGGFNDKAGIVLDLVSAFPGDLRAVVTNVPATGWTDGYTFFSFNSFGKPGFGTFFGLEADFITTAILGMPATAGDLFHFTNTGGVYPFATATVPPSIAVALSGLTIDGMVTLFGPTGIVDQSNVDRVTVQ